MIILKGCHDEMTMDDSISDVTVLLIAKNLYDRHQ